MSANQKHDSSADLKVAFFLNLTFTIFEIVGGLLTNSLAILSDSLHDLGDSVSLGLSWYLERYSLRKSDRRFSYGYRRFSMLGALVNTIVLIAGSLLIIIVALPRLLEPEPTHTTGMILFAIAGMAVNGAAVLRLRRSTTLNARVVAWHLLEDVMGWGAVLIVSIVLRFTDWYFLDPLLAILITTYVLFNVGRNLKKTIGLFLQAVPEQLDLDDLIKQLQQVNLVKSTHHTHVWSLDGQNHVLTSHVVVDECATKDDILTVKREIQAITNGMDFSHTTIEIELDGDPCMMAEE